MKNKPSMLIILDGFGYSKAKKYNAIYQAHTLVMKWFKQFPSTLLKASGTAVGLLKGMIGNSEVGHLTIGAGRIIKQPVSILHDQIKNGSFFKNKDLIKLFKLLKKSDGTLHLMGLLSDAGVHSHEENLHALLKLAAKVGIKNVIIHPFLDGRDVPPKSAEIYLKKLNHKIKKYNLGKIGSIHGRFYAMDRDKNWNRTQKSYEVLTKPPSPIKFKNWQEALKHFYEEGITDEFIPPTALSNNAYIQEGDGILFFNFREDRARQLTQAIVDPKFKYFPKKKQINYSWIVTGVQYHPDFPVDSVLYIKEEIKNTFFDYLEKQRKKIFSIAETEKYAHITYFFNGGREIIRPNETRVLIPSKSYKHTYADIPEMSAKEIADAVLSSLKNDLQDFYLINFANPDMVAHSGDLEATIKALKFIDKQLRRIYKVMIEKLDGTIYITSDHGNAEDLFNVTMDQPRTAHTTNPVPFIVLTKKVQKQKLRLNKLSDIAPYILKKIK